MGAGAGTGTRTGTRTGIGTRTRIGTESGSGTGTGTGTKLGRNRDHHRDWNRESGQRTGTAIGSGNGTVPGPELGSRGGEGVGVMANAYACLSFIAWIGVVLRLRRVSFGAGEDSAVARAPKRPSPPPCLLGVGLGPCHRRAVRVNGMTSRCLGYGRGLWRRLFLHVCLRCTSDGISDMWTHDV